MLIFSRIEQVGFAYQIYKGTSKTNNSLANGFKRTFSRTVKIEFMGCWLVTLRHILQLRYADHFLRDTVSSVGVFWGHHLPFTSSNTSIKCFRHALSLDEVRLLYGQPFSLCFASLLISHCSISTFFLAPCQIPAEYLAQRCSE